MSLLTVVRDVCAVVGVTAPVSVFSGLNSSRTMFEMLACANEMAQRIAYDTRDWVELTAGGTFTGDGVKNDFPLPANFKRLLLNSNAWRSSTLQTPLRYISDPDEQTRRYLANETDARGEWYIYGGRNVWIAPALLVGETVTITYLDKNCVGLASGGFGDRFQSDNDTFRLDERLLKLGMTFDWKMKKGSPYAEDMATYQDAVSNVMGHDKPAPIILMGRHATQGRVAYQGQVPWP